MHGEDPFSAVWSDKSMRPPPPSQVLQEKRKARVEAALEAKAPLWWTRAASHATHSGEGTLGGDTVQQDEAPSSSGRENEKWVAPAEVATAIMQDPWPTIHLPHHTIHHNLQTKTQEREKPEDASSGPSSGSPPPEGLVWLTRLGIAAAAFVWALKARGRL